MLETIIENNLKELKKIIGDMTDSEYTSKHAILENASLGQHIRHILEMFECLYLGYEDGLVNYDRRKRSIDIETDRKYAAVMLDRILENLQHADKPMRLIALVDPENEMELQTTFKRELLYNLEHMIHHEAIMKRALVKCENVVLDERFGFAPSTIKFQNKVMKGGSK